MGLRQSRQSFDEYTSDEIARGVAWLGGAYVGYALDCRKNGVDGQFLMELSATELSETMDDLGIDVKLHRTVLGRVLKDSMDDANSADAVEDWEFLEEKSEEFTEASCLSKDSFSKPDFSLQAKFLLESLTAETAKQRKQSVKAQRTPIRATNHAA